MTSDSDARAPRYFRALTQTRLRVAIVVVLVSAAGASVVWTFDASPETPSTPGAALRPPTIVVSPPASIVAPPLAPVVTPPALAAARLPTSTVTQRSMTPSCAGSPGFLVRLVRESDSFRVRTRAADALGSVGASECTDVVSALLVAVEHDAEAAVRAAAADALGRIGDASALAGLVVAAYVDPNVDVRAHARAALDALHARLQPHADLAVTPLEHE